MGRKVYFKDSEAAHDFNKRIGAGRVDLECQDGDDHNTYVVDTDLASWGEDNPYGEDPDKE